MRYTLKICHVGMVSLMEKLILFTPLILTKQMEVMLLCMVN